MPCGDAAAPAVWGGSEDRAARRGAERRRTAAIQAHLDQAKPVGQGTGIRWYIKYGFIIFNHIIRFYIKMPHPCCHPIPKVPCKVRCRPVGRHCTARSTRRTPPTVSTPLPPRS